MNTVMKRIPNIIPFLFCSLLLLCSGCIKSDDDCHRYLEIINNSPNPIIYSNKLYDASALDSCILTKTAVLRQEMDMNSFKGLVGRKT